MIVRIKQPDFRHASSTGVVIISETSILGLILHVRMDNGFVVPYLEDEVEVLS